LLQIPMMNEVNRQTSM